MTRRQVTWSATSYCTMSRRRSLWSIALHPTAEGKRPHERPRRRWEYNIKMDLQEVGRGMDWIYLSIGIGGRRL